MALPGLSLDRIRLRGTGDWPGTLSRLVNEKPGQSNQSSRRRWRSRNPGSFSVARPTARAALRCVRLLAHEPRFLPRTGRGPADPDVSSLPVVSRGDRRVVLQPACANGSDIFARLLGAHGIRLRSVFDIDEA